LQYSKSCFYEPIIVVGTGRSGTSSTAKILHEELGISMGREFVTPDDSNPDGFYEDKVLRDTFNECAIKGLPLYTVKKEFEKFIIHQRALNKPWGFKDPRVVDLLNEFLLYFRQPKFVYCTRKAEDIAQSMIKWYNWTYDYAHQLAMNRIEAIEKNIILKGYPYVEISIDDHIIGLAKQKLIDFLDKEKYNG